MRFHIFFHVQYKSPYQGVIGTGTLVRNLSRISGICPYDSLDLLIQKCHCHFVILSKLSIFRGVDKKKEKSIILNNMLYIIYNI